MPTQRPEVTVVALTTVVVFAAAETAVAARATLMRRVHASCSYFLVRCPTAASAVVQFTAMARCITASGTRPLHTSDFAFPSTESFGLW